MCSDEELALEGFIGIIPVGFCEICWNGLVEYIHSLEPCKHGWDCRECEDDDDS
jgi:hypothetical protein